VNQQGLFLQNIIAVIWDFDRTLSPRYMQKPLFDHFGIDEKTFWAEVGELSAYYQKAEISVHKDTSYLVHLLSYVQNGVMKGLTNGKLRELGAEIDFFPGMPFFLDELRGLLDSEEYRQGDLKLEHYVVSTGLEAMIQGTEIFDKVDGVWASSFIETPAKPGQDFSETPLAGEISQIAGFLDNTTKTRALFEINKGVNISDQFSVNDSIPLAKRRVPFQNMIYIADGPSDIPSFSVMRNNGGFAYAVYDPEAEGHFEQAVKLNEDGRVNDYGPADYTSGSTTSLRLKLQIRNIADGIMAARKTQTESSFSKAPEH